MLAALAALLIAQQTPAPSDVRLETFKRACVPHRQDLVAAAVALEADGWNRAADNDHPELAATMRRAREEAMDPELEMTVDFTVWLKAVGGRRLYVVLNRADAILREEADDDGDGEIQDWEKENRFSLLGCGLWDFDATTPIDPAAMTAWVGAAPVQVFDLPDDIVGGTWNVFDMLPGTAEVHIGYIPEGSEMFGRTGFSGVSITMSTVPVPVEADD